MNVGTQLFTMTLPVGVLPNNTVENADKACQQRRDEILRAMFLQIHNPIWVGNPGEHCRVVRAELEYRPRRAIEAKELQHEESRERYSQGHLGVKHTKMD